MSDPIHSTGRGGAGNIGVDKTVYTDGEIVREVNPEGGEHSTGRGGLGNVEHGKPERSTGDDFVPETATRDVHQSVYHTGRGGEGNVHRDAGHEKDGHIGLGAKVKHALGLDKKDKAATETDKA